MGCAGPRSVLRHYGTTQTSWFHGGYIGVGGYPGLEAVLKGVPQFGESCRDALINTSRSPFRVMY